MEEDLKQSNNQPETLEISVVDEIKQADGLV